MPKLAWIDQATGLPVRRPTVNRYEASAPGELVHVDIKKLGRIPHGGGWRLYGRGSAQDLAAVRSSKQQARTGAPASRGYRFLHHAVDDHSRVAYSEILDDERKHTAAGFWARAEAFFANIGVQVSAVMTDNGSCYRSGAFKAALGEEIKHKRTRPRRPQTNGKVERFNRTLMSEWAYARPFTSEGAREASYGDFLHYYNHCESRGGWSGTGWQDGRRVALRLGRGSYNYSPLRGALRWTCPARHRVADADPAHSDGFIRRLSAPRHNGEVVTHHSTAPK